MKGIVKLVSVGVFSVFILACNGEDRSTVEVARGAESAQAVVAAEVVTEKSNSATKTAGRDIHVNGVVERREKKTRDGSEGRLVYIIRTEVGEKFRLPESVSAEAYVGKSVAADLLVVDKEGRGGKEKTVVISVSSITLTSGE